MIDGIDGTDGIDGIERADPAGGAPPEAEGAPPGDGPIELRPRFRHQLWEVLLGAPFLGATVAFLLRVASGIDSMRFVIAFGAASALGFIALYLLRFRLAAPRAVRLDAEGIRVAGKARTEELAWAWVRRARHRARNGLRWELRTSEGEEPRLVLRDDGFSVKEWERISERIEGELRRRGVEIETDAFGKLFRAE